MIADESWWQKGAVVILLLIILAFSDALNMYALFEELLIESVAVLLFVTASVAICLTLIPLILGHLMRLKYYGLAKVSNVWLAVLLATFVLLFAVTAYIRWETRDLNYVDLGTTMQNTADMTANVMTQEEKANSASAIATTIILMVMPMITSIVAFFLGWISSDPLKNEIKYYRQLVVQLESKHVELQGAINELQVLSGDEYINELLQLDDMKCAQMHMELYSKGEYMKNRSRYLLAESLKKGPRAINTVVNSYGETAETEA